MVHGPTIQFVWEQQVSHHPLHPVLLSGTSPPFPFPLFSLILSLSQSPFLPLSLSFPIVPLSTILSPILILPPFSLLYSPPSY